MNRALQYCLKLLTKKDYTATELQRKLSLHQFEATEADEAIKILVQKSFIDDKRYAYNYAMGHFSRGKLRIRYELMKKGIPENIIADIINGQDTDKEYKRALGIAQKWIAHKSPAEDKYKFKQKLMAKLSRQGFEYGVTRQILEDLIK